MDASNWINLGIFLLSAVAVAIAARQAAHAKSSAEDAKAHEEAALLASRKSAEANERAAAALEEANALVREQTAKPRWQLTDMGDKKYRLENQGPGAAHDVSIECLEHPAVVVHTGEHPRAVLGEGLAISFLRRRAMGMPADPTLVIAWTDPESGDRDEVHVTL
jgi:hypothetical protein